MSSQYVPPEIRETHLGGDLGKLKRRLDHSACQVCWCALLFPVLGRQRQQLSEFEASLLYMISRTARVT